jgi:hypothetical protein
MNGCWDRTTRLGVDAIGWRRQYADRAKPGNVAMPHLPAGSMRLDHAGL